MYLNTILESAVALDEGNYVEIVSDLGVMYGRVVDASIEGDMFAFRITSNNEVFYLSKQHVISVKFVDVLPPPLDAGPEIPEEE